VPAEAKAIVNFRLLPGDTIADVLWHAKKVIKDERVHIKPVEGKFNEALPVSPTNGPGLRQPQAGDPPGVRQPARGALRHAGRHRLPALSCRCAIISTASPRW
jgi:acetylornithine deacetylase/succinyl-diaminopimelate desuccinylase-like protein